MTITLSEIRRYPVKGMNGESLAEAELVTDAPLAHDRRFALAHASSGVDRQSPAWMPKNHFLNLSRDEKITQLSVRFDPATSRLVIERGGRQVAAGDPTQTLGRTMLDQFFQGFVPAGARGNPRIVEAGKTAFADSPEPFISIVNAASIAEIERVARQPVDPRRFRANILFTGAERWEERDWIGRTIAVGGAQMRIDEPIERCAATNVDPDSSERDLNIPRVLERGFGHLECGVHGRVVSPGLIEVGDTVSLVP